MRRLTCTIQDHGDEMTILGRDVRRAVWVRSQEGGLIIRDFVHDDLEAVWVMAGKKGCEAFDTIRKTGVEGFMLLRIVTREKRQLRKIDRELRDALRTIQNTAIHRTLIERMLARIEPRHDASPMEVMLVATNLRDHNVGLLSVDTPVTRWLGHKREQTDRTAPILGEVVACLESSVDGESACVDHGGSCVVGSCGGVHGVQELSDAAVVGNMLEAFYNRGAGRVVGVQCLGRVHGVAEQ
jgi:hypothetical protein